MMAPTLPKATLLLLAQLHLARRVALAPRQQVSGNYEAAASSGDTCQSLSAAWGVSVQTFESLDPGVTYPTLVAG